MKSLTKRLRLVLPALILITVLLSATGVLALGVVARVSVDSFGTQGNSTSLWPSISGDGRYIVFRSLATNLVANDMNGRPDIFLHDSLSGSTKRISIASDGTEGNAASAAPSISSDGCIVAFHSLASTLVAVDANGGMDDVFVYDCNDDSITLVSVSSLGVQGNNNSTFPSVSSDGRYIAYRSYASNLVAGDTNATADIFVYDRLTQMTTLASVASDGTQGNAPSEYPSISGGSCYVVAFRSTASTLVPNDTNGAIDIFTHDCNGNTTRISVDSSGAQATGYSYEPSISDDGRYVAFHSYASDLVTGDTNAQSDIFVRDLQNNLTERVSVDSSGVQGGGSSFYASISGDGRYIAFQSDATNLVIGDGNLAGDVFVHDRQSGVTTRVSIDSNGVEGNGNSQRTSISSDGRYVAFQSAANNLLAIPDTNGVDDIFVSEARGDIIPPTVTINQGVTQVDPTNTAPIIFDVVFSEDVTGFDNSDVNISGMAGAATITVSSTGTGTYTVQVSGMVDGETVTATIPANAAQDAGGNDNIASASLDNSVTYDISAPTVAITSAASDPTNTSPIPVTINFSENVIGFDIGDISVGNGAASNFSGFGATYTVDITPTADGEVTVDVAANAAQDSAGNDNTAATQFSINYDTSAPTVGITSAASDPTNTSPISITITFSEGVTGFAIGDIMVGSGTASNFVDVGAGVYSVDIAPAMDGTVTVDVSANVAQDFAGNNNTAATQFSINYDASAPTVTINSTASDPTNISPIPVTITFSENVNGFDIGDISVGNGTASNFSGLGASYSVDITPIADGAVTVDVAANAAQDSAGNNNTAATQFSINYDASAPTVTISSTASDPTNISPIPITINFSENVNGFDIGDITVGNGTASNFSGSDASYSIDITPTTDAVVTVDIAANVAQDSVGNDNIVATQFSINYNSSAPTVNIASTASDPTNISPIPVTITFSESVNGFTVDDITVGNGTASNFSGSGASYSIDITPTADGAVSVDVAANIAQDFAGNNNTAATQFAISYDVSAPTITITSTASDPTNTNPIPITITFSENVTGFDIGDISVGNGTASNFAGLGASYTIDVTPTTEGVVTVDIAANLAQDSAGNDNIAATQFSITYDSSGPSVTIEQGAAQSDPTNNSPIVFDIVFSEDVTGFDNTDVNISGMAAPTITVTSTGTGDTYTAQVSGMVDGETVTATIPANAAQDASGNDNATSTSTDNSVTYDTTAIVIIADGTVAQPNNTALQNLENYYTQFTSLEITFGADANNPVGNSDPEDVTNPNNYLLIQSGANIAYDTGTCLAYSLNGNSVLGDDIQIPTGAVTYDSGAFTATVGLNNGSPLPIGEYRLLVCGTTSITDLAGNHLNNGSDSVTTFRIAPVPSLLPETGFPHGRVTALNEQPAAKAYAETAMTLEIPSLNLNIPIVGVPQSENGWDVTWLDNSAGYLAGSAFPTWVGNTVITGHVWDAFNRPGVFAEIKNLKYGDQVQIHAWGLVYTYEVRESKLVTSKNVNSVLQSEEYDWVTLVTCEFYNPFSGEYLFRRAVRAVLVDVK